MLILSYKFDQTTNDELKNFKNVSIFDIVDYLKLTLP